MQFPIPIGHSLDNLYQARGVTAIGIGHGRKRGVVEEVLVHLVLEDDAADRDADGLAQGAEEAEHADGDGQVLRRGGGLDCEAEGGEKDAEADAANEVEEDPAGDAGVDFDVAEEAHAEG